MAQHRYWDAEREQVWSRGRAVRFDHATRACAALVPEWTAGPITRGGLRWRPIRHLFEALKFEHDPPVQPRIAERTHAQERSKEDGGETDQRSETGRVDPRKEGRARRSDATAQSEADGPPSGT